MSTSTSVYNSRCRSSLAIFAMSCVRLLISPTLRTRGQLSTWRRLSHLCRPRTFTFIHFYHQQQETVIKLSNFKVSQYRTANTSCFKVWTDDLTWEECCWHYVFHTDIEHTEQWHHTCACFWNPHSSIVCVSPKQKLNTDLKGTVYPILKVISPMNI